jgi:hypothetical protein
LTLLIYGGFGPAGDERSMKPGSKSLSGSGKQSNYQDAIHLCKFRCDRLIFCDISVHLNWFQNFKSQYATSSLGGSRKKANAKLPEGQLLRSTVLLMKSHHLRRKFEYATIYSYLCQ